MQLPFVIIIYGQRGSNLNYTLSGNQITLYPPAGVDDNPETMEYRVEGDTLFLTDEVQTVTLTK